MIDKATAERRKMSIGAVGYNSNYYHQNESQDNKTQSGDISDFLKAVQSCKDANQLTAEELKEDKDWRELSDDEWEKLLEGVDDYIDAAKEQIRYLKKKQDEAAVKAAMQADSDSKAAAASSAALKAAASGSDSTVEENSDDSTDYKKNWTKNLETDDQTVLRTAKAAQDMEKMAMSKVQEIQLTDYTQTGVTRTENVMECTSVEEDENKDKIWTITSFGEDGIISKRFKNGKELDSWEIKYKTPDEAVKVWDFLSKLEDDEKLKLAGSKDFWMEFLY